MEKEAGRMADQADRPVDQLTLAVGHIYRGRRRRQNPFTGKYDDRIIIYLNKTTVQYDSYFVANGRGNPTTTRAAFLRWAKEEIVEEP